MAKKRYYMPSGWAGLLRFPEEEKNKIKLRPEFIVYVSLAIIFIELLLRLIAP